MTAILRRSASTSELLEHELRQHLDVLRGRRLGVVREVGALRKEPGGPFVGVVAPDDRAEVDLGARVAEVLLALHLAEEAAVVGAARALLDVDGGREAVAPPLALEDEELALEEDLLADAPLVERR